MNMYKMSKKFSQVSLKQDPGYLKTKLKGNIPKGSKMLKNRLNTKYPYYSIYFLFCWGLGLVFIRTTTLPTYDFN